MGCLQKNYPALICGRSRNKNEYFLLNKIFLNLLLIIIIIIRLIRSFG